MSWCEDYLDPFPRECEHGVPDGIRCGECAAEIEEAQDEDFASCPHPSAHYERTEQ